MINTYVSSFRLANVRKTDDKYLVTKLEDEHDLQCHLLISEPNIIKLFQLKQILSIDTILVITQMTKNQIFKLPLNILMIYRPINT